MRPNTPEHKKKKQFVLDEEKRFEHYQKLYFHELEFREKLHARVGLPLTITISLLGATGVLWQLINSTAGDFFVLKLLIAATTCVVLWGAYFLWRSFCGHTYSGMPSAADSEQYRKLLDKTYEPYYDEGKKLSARYFKDYIVDYLIQRSSANASTNELRAFQLHRANHILFCAAALLACIGVIFFMFEPKKPLPSIQIQGSVEIKSPVEIKPMQTNSQIMSRIPPPPPPPPPPPREIKEGVRPSAPPQKLPTK